MSVQHCPDCIRIGDHTFDVLFSLGDQDDPTPIGTYEVPLYACLATDPPEMVPEVRG